MTSLPDRPGTGRAILGRYRHWRLRRRFRVGRRLTRFVARDVRREVLVTSTDQLAEGLILGRVRTVNVLYATKGLLADPEFGPEQQLQIDDLWAWSGHAWGGLEDSRSLVDDVDQDPAPQLEDDPEQPG